MSSTADIGIRVFLDDAATGGLTSINGALSKLGSGVANAALGIGKLKEAQMNAVGVTLGFGAALGIFTSFLGGSIDAASDLEQALFRVKIATNASNEEMDRMKSVLIQLDAQSKFSMNQIAESFTILGQRGFSATDIMNGLGLATTQLAVATGQDLNDAAKLVSGTMAIFGVNVKDAGKVVDLLQYAVEHGINSMSSWNSALSQVGPTAKTLKMPLNETIAAIDVLGRAFNSNEKAGTSLNYMLTALTSPTKAARTAMVDLGLITVQNKGKFDEWAQQLVNLGYITDDFKKHNEGSATGMEVLFNIAKQAGLIGLDKQFYDWALQAGYLKNQAFDAKGNFKDFGDVLQTVYNKIKDLPLEQQKERLHELFNVRSGQGAQQLLNDIDEYNKRMKELTSTNNNAGKSQERFNEAQHTFAVALESVKSSWSSLQAIVGGGFTAAMAPVLNFFSSLMQPFNQLLVKNPMLATTFVSVGTALAGVGLVGGIALTLFLGIGTTLAIIVAIALNTVFAVVALSVTITLLVAAFQRWWNAGGPVVDFLKQLGGVIGGVFSQLGGTLGPVFAQIGQVFQQMVPTLQQLWSVLSPVLIGLGLIIGGVLVVALGVVIALIAGLAQGLSQLLLGVTMVIQGIIQIITGAIQIAVGIVETIVGVIVGIFTGNWSMAIAGLQTMLQGLGNIFSGIFNVILGVVTGVLGFIIGFVMGFINAIINFFTHLWSVLVGHSIIPDMMTAIMNVFNSGLNFVRNLVMGFINGVISFFANLLARAVLLAIQLWAAVQAAWNSGVNFVKGIVSGFISNVVGFFGGLVGTLRQKGSDAINGFKNAVSNGISNVINLARALPGQIGAALGGLAGSMYNWGRDMLQGLINGINSMAQAVKDAAANVAQNIKNVLGHSTPVEGPLMNDDTYMPDMMSMFAEGIKKDTPKVVGQLNLLAGQMSSVPANMRLTAPAFVASNTPSQQRQPINIYLGNNLIYQGFVDGLTHDLQMNGVGRMMR